YMSDGDPADNVTVLYTPSKGGSRHPKGVPYNKADNPGKGVHVAYEDKMIDDYIDQILPAIETAIQDAHSTNQASKIDDNLYEVIDLVNISNGQEAGYAVLQLMHETQLDIKPKDIVEVFKKAKGNKDDVSDKLYENFGDNTAVCMARGCKYLA